MFLSALVVLFYMLPHRTRWFLLLLASYYFYGSWNSSYLLLIVFTTLVSYLAARKISRTKNKKTRLRLLWLGIGANILPLLLYKYYDFAAESLNSLARLIHWNYSIETLQLLLPIGISFFTFQTLSYTIDVYHKKIQPEKNLGIYALFVGFFPQILAGPISRAGNLIPQLKVKLTFAHANFRDGLTMIAWGLFKKIVIADRLAVGVNAVFDNVGLHSGLAYIIATLMFTIQIYCDFSGYSDMAIGSAKIFGIDLIRNFDRPYFAKSVGEFWRRWHISLSSWFRDYVYIPLGGNRVVKWRWYYNLFLTFLVSGLWHGAAWTFVIWGALHGIYMVIGAITRGPKDKVLARLAIKKTGWLYKLGSAGLTFGLVALAWIFFRSNSITDAFHIISNLSVGVVQDVANFDFRELAKSIGMTPANLVIGGLAVVIMLLAHFLTRKFEQPISAVAKLPIYLRWPLYYALILTIIFFGVYESSEFIYFQF